MSGIIYTISVYFLGLKFTLLPPRSPVACAQGQLSDMALIQIHTTMKEELLKKEA